MLVAAGALGNGVAQGDDCRQEDCQCRVSIQKTMKGEDEQMIHSTQTMTRRAESCWHQPIVSVYSVKSRNISRARAPADGKWRTSRDHSAVEGGSVPSGGGERIERWTSLG